MALAANPTAPIDGVTGVTAQLVTISKDQVEAITTALGSVTKSVQAMAKSMGGKGAGVLGATTATGGATAATKSMFSSLLPVKARGVTREAVKKTNPEQVLVYDQLRLIYLNDLKKAKGKSGIVGAILKGVALLAAGLLAAVKMIFSKLFGALSHLPFVGKMFGGLSRMLGGGLGRNGQPAGARTRPYKDAQGRWRTAGNQYTQKPTLRQRMSGRMGAGTPGGSAFRTGGKVIGAAMLAKDFLADGLPELMKGNVGKAVKHTLLGKQDKDESPLAYVAQNTAKWGALGASFGPWGAVIGASLGALAGILTAKDYRGAKGQLRKFNDDISDIKDDRADLAKKRKMLLDELNNEYMSDDERAKRKAEIAELDKQIDGKDLELKKLEMGRRKQEWEALKETLKEKKSDTWRNLKEGAATGAAIGAFIPVIGPVVGAFIGGLTGALFGRKRSDMEKKLNQFTEAMEGLQKDKDAIVDENKKLNDCLQNEVHTEEERLEIKRKMAENEDKLMDKEKKMQWLRDQRTEILDKQTSMDVKNAVALSKTISTLTGRTSMQAIGLQSSTGMDFEHSKKLAERMEERKAAAEGFRKKKLDVLNSDATEGEKKTLLTDLERKEQAYYTTFDKETKAMPWFNKKAIEKYEEFVVQQKASTAEIGKLMGTKNVTLEMVRNAILKKSNEDVYKEQAETFMSGKKLTKVGNKVYQHTGPTIMDVTSDIEEGVLPFITSTATGDKATDIQGYLVLKEIMRKKSLLEKPFTLVGDSEHPDVDFGAYQPFLHGDHPSSRGSLSDLKDLIGWSSTPEFLGKMLDLAPWAGPRGARMVKDAAIIDGKMVQYSPTDELHFMDKNSPIAQLVAMARGTKKLDLNSLIGAGAPMMTSNQSKDSGSSAILSQIATVLGDIKTGLSNIKTTVVNNTPSRFNTMSNFNPESAHI